jgi:transposase
MMNNHKALAPPLAALPSAGQREGERSEADRSSADGKAGLDSNLEPRANPEVVARAKRRSFTGDYKQRILVAADRAKESGDVGALLRREGLYSSHLVTWRREREAGSLQALTPKRRGPKVKRNALEEENQKLQKENQRLCDRLRTAEIIIDVQKKVAALLGRPILSPDLEERP